MLQLTVMRDRDDVQLGAVLAKLHHTLPDLAGKIRLSFQDEPKIGLPWSEASRIAVELQIKLREIAPEAVAEACGVDQGYELRVYLPKNDMEVGAQVAADIAVKERIPVSVIKLG